jgi:hypothetical protein
MILPYPPRRLVQEAKHGGVLSEIPPMVRSVEPVLKETQKLLVSTASCTKTSHRHTEIWRYDLEI